jgi:6-pyruvoyltetrahydropterin/6-carboxytetrahydropterin synthase
MILREDDPAVPFLKSLGEPVVLIPKNPTAENIARLIFDHARSAGLPVTEVSLWESARSCATYCPTER